MRHELTDFEWAAIRPFLPNKPRGISRVDDRRVLNGIFWVLAVYFKCQISANYVCQKSAKRRYHPMRPVVLNAPENRCACKP